MTSAAVVRSSSTVARAPRAIATVPVPAQAPAAGGWLRGVVRAAMRAMLTWYARDRERRALAALDARMLRDIGLTRTDVAVEVEKRFWER